MKNTAFMLFTLFVFASPAGTQTPSSIGCYGERVFAVPSDFSLVGEELEVRIGETGPRQENVTVDLIFSGGRTLPAIARGKAVPGTHQFHTLSLDQSLRAASLREVRVTDNGDACNGVYAGAELNLVELRTVIGKRDISAVVFEIDSYKLNQSTMHILDRELSSIDFALISEVGIEGHTCDIGTEAYNNRLSENRAQTVANYLRSRPGDEAPPVTARGMGEHDPKFKGTSESDRAGNRRVEIRMYGTPLTFLGKAK